MSWPELLNRLYDFWGDFNTVGRRNFSELYPSDLQKWLDLDRGRVDYAEFARARWMWNRKPRWSLGEGMFGYILPVFVGLLLLFRPYLGTPLAAAWSLAVFVAIVNNTIRVARWRREYESGFARVIRSSRKAK